MRRAPSSGGRCGIDVFAVVRQERVVGVHAVDILAHLGIHIGEDVLLARDADRLSIFARKHERRPVEDEYVKDAAFPLQQIGRARHVGGVDLRIILAEGRVGIGAVADLDDSAERYKLVVRIFPAPLRFRRSRRLRGRRRFACRLCRVGARLRRGRRFACRLCRVGARLRRRRRRNGDLVSGGGIAVHRYGGVAVQRFEPLRGHDPAVTPRERVRKPEADIGKIAPVRHGGKRKLRKRLQRALFLCRYRRAQRQDPRDNRENAQRKEKGQSPPMGAAFLFFRMGAAAHRFVFVVHRIPLRTGSIGTD